ncbi:MAG: hypothetical protein HY556_11295 [Euryarchaeota archaeon]|nr:hypothetical protein [Euryarchaeota archaeon]
MSRTSALLVALLFIPVGAVSASEFFTRERPVNFFTETQCPILYDPQLCGGNVIEDHTTYRVIVKESDFNATFVDEHNFSAVAGYAREILHHCPDTFDGHNNVSWFNDQFFIDAALLAFSTGPCIEEEPCASQDCYMVAIEEGGPDPGDLFPSSFNTFKYHFTDPNGVAWETREYWGRGWYFWVTTIGSTVTDSVGNLAGGTTNRGTTTASTLNVAKGMPNGSDNTYVNGCAPGDVPSIPSCPTGGTDHNPAGEGGNTRTYNFAMLIDIRGSPGFGSPPVNKISNMPSLLACTSTASDDGNSHDSQGSHLGGCPHAHRAGKVDLWFSRTQPSSAFGTTLTFGSTYAYHA